MAQITGVVTRGGSGVPALVEIFRAGDADATDLCYGLDRDRWKPFDVLFARWYGLALGPPIRTVRTNLEGRFLLEDLPVGVYVLWATDATGRMGHRNIVLSTPHVHREGTVRIRDGGNSFSARVFRRAGEPFVGEVVVRTYRVGDAREEVVGRFRADAAGRLTAHGVPDGPVRLLIRQESDATATSPPFDVPSAQPIVWTIEAKPGREISLQVVARDDGRGIEGALVQARARTPEGTDLTRATRTDAAGRFVLRMAGDVRGIQAIAPGFGPAARAPPAPGVGVEFRLHRRHELSGRVFEKGTDRAVPGATVLGIDMGIGSDRTVAIADSEGRFTLRGLRTGEAMVISLGGGWVSDRLWDVGWQAFNPFIIRLPAQDPAPLRVEVVPSSVLSGRVVDHAGAPVAGARVIPRLKSTPASHDRPLWAYRASVFVATAADGSFRHDGLIPHSAYVFRVEAAGRPALDSDVVVTRVGDGNAALQVRLPAPKERQRPKSKTPDMTPESRVAVSGRVLVPDGHSAQGLIVEAMRDHAKSRGYASRAVARKDGSFRIEGLRPDAYSLRVEREFEGAILHGYADVEAPASGIRLEAEYVDFLSEEPTFEDIHGRGPQMNLKVTLPDGTPLPSAGVGVHPASLNSHYDLHDGEARVAAPRGAQAICLEFPGSSDPGRAYGGGVYGPFSTDEETLIVRLQPANMLRGFVLGPDGRGVAGVRVSTLPECSLRKDPISHHHYWYARHKAWTDAEGRFTIRGLRAGAWAVAVAAPTDFIQVETFAMTLPAKARVIALRRGKEAEVRVRDGHGRPLPGAEVSAWRLSGAEDRRARTGRDGNARLRGLDPAGRYVLSVYPPTSDVPPDLAAERTAGWIPCDGTVRLQKKAP